MRTDILERKEEILQWIDENQSKAFICRQLQCKPETLNSYLTQMEIDYAGNKGQKGIQKNTNYKTAEEYIQSTCVKSHTLKEKLIRDGIKEKACEICGVSLWQGIELPLELHHKDGNHFNNDFNNLQILCPNCHSIQKGNSGANIGNYNNQQRLCSECGIPISKSSKSGKCKSCAAKSSLNHERKVSLDNRPSRDELKMLIRNQSFVEIGKKYGVSDNAVRKWCKTENLPSTKKEINIYSNEEWDNV